MEEQLDILNEKGEKTGESRTKNETHRLGLWHRVVHVWFLNSKGQLLLQKRSKDIISYPNLWDMSAAGHISTGQSSLEAAQRETQEELGVFLPHDHFKYLVTLKESVILNQGTYKDNEFLDVYLVHSDLALSEFKMQPEEVEEIRWINLKDFKKWMEGAGEKLVPHKEEHEKLLEYLSLNKNV